MQALMNAHRRGRFERAARKRGRTALIPYVTAGDPVARGDRPLMHALVDAGADVIELGVPFSDPMADGPVIQRASERALAAGVGLRDVLALVARVSPQRQRDAVVLMGYANPVEAMGVAAFVAAARRPAWTACSSSTIRPRKPPSSRRARGARHRADLPARADDARGAHRRGRSAARAATSTTSRCKGVTGAGHLDTRDVARKLAEIRAHVTCRSASASASATPRARARSPQMPTRSSSAAASSRRSRAGRRAEAASRAGAFLGRFRTALDPEASTA